MIIKMTKARLGITSSCNIYDKMRIEKAQHFDLQWSIGKNAYICFHLIEIDMIVLIILAALLLIMGIIVLIGKGDNLIAGYNTASKEERSQYNVKRLRGLIGGLSIVLAPMMLLLLGRDSLAASGSFAGLTLVLCIVVVILANTWAKKK